MSDIDEAPVAPREAARVLGIDERTLEGWRRKGTGPEYIRYSHKCVRYQPAALREFKARKTYPNTAIERNTTPDDADRET